MDQPKQALPKRRPQIRDHQSGQTHRFGTGEPDRKRASEAASLPQDARQDEHQDEHQDPWVTNFIGRLAGLVRDVGGKK
jgi:hypothetical protein